MKNLILFVIMIIMFSCFGCAKTLDSIKAKGGVFGTHRAPYIVVVKEGGVVVDVYKLKNSFVQRESNYLFIDNNKLPISLEGTIKIIRLKDINCNTWKMYKEYHSDINNLTYQEFLKK